jgi:hypothetical protein
MVACTAHDLAGNRTGRAVPCQTDLNQAYAYDGLDRLRGYQQGAGMTPDR